MIMEQYIIDFHLFIYFISINVSLYVKYILFLKLNIEIKLNLFIVVDYLF